MINNLFSRFQPDSKNSDHSKSFLQKRLALISGFLILASFFFFILKDNFLTVHEVEVTKAILYPENINENSSAIFSTGKKGDLLFQASGWIEPDPFPIKVTSLYSGVVKNVHVLEGEKIAKGDIIATLIDEDARLVYSEIKAKCSQSISEEAIIKSDIKLAIAGLEAAESTVTKSQTFLKENNDTLNRMTSLSRGAVSDQAIYQAKIAYERQKAEVVTSKAEVKQQKALIRKLEDTLIVQKKKSEILKIQRQKAELDLNRTKITSPIDGIVLRLLAKPGSRMMLHMDDMDAAAAAIMFEEGKLQARIDVPLSEAAKINLGQLVEISSSILPKETFRGKITRILGEADLQRNTLQVKVSLIDTHPRLRPEMLCRAKFFAINTKKINKDFSELKIFIKKNFLSIQSSLTRQEMDLWVISKDGKTCEKRKVSLGNTIRDEYIEISKGLLAGDKIIIDPPENLRDGDQVKVIEIL